MKEENPRNSGLQSPRVWGCVECVAGCHETITCYIVMGFQSSDLCTELSSKCKSKPLICAAVNGRHYSCSGLCSLFAPNLVQHL